MGWGGVARDATAAVQQMGCHLDDIESDLLQDNKTEEKPSLESVLVKYASQATAQPGIKKRAATGK